MGSDDGDMWREYRAEKKKKRRDNLDNSINLLMEKGINFESRNDGVHLIIKANGKTINFWPSTGKYEIDGKYKRGVFNLLKYIEQLS